jgi:hypothetical protein
MIEKAKFRLSRVGAALLGIFFGIVAGISGTLLAMPFIVEPPERVEYPVSLLAVCEFQGHAGVTDKSDNTNPYQWVCYDEEPGDLPFPDAGLNIHAWCGATYKGSSAEVVDESTAFGWRCVVHL